jgi:hypothetical protein
MITTNSRKLAMQMGEAKNVAHVYTAAELLIEAFCISLQNSSGSSFA